MGKKGKIKTGSGDIVTLPGPLHKQIEKATFAKTKYKTPKQSHKEGKSVEFVDPSTSSKILSEAQKQWKEEEEMKQENSQNTTEDLGEEHATSDEDEEEIVEQQTKDLDEFNQHIEKEEAVNNKKKKNRKEEKTGQVGMSLYDLIQQKAVQKEKGTEIGTGDDDIEYQDVDPAVVKLYTEVGQVMEKYRTGKVPKAFKIIPTLANWEQILELTCPDKWTAAAMLQATRMFSATATPAQCQKFYNFVLLPRVRDDIDEFKKLHFHMYQCLFKAMFKPAAFFKGILLPLCRSSTCTLREAVVLGSVLRKVSIPQMHAAAAMLSLAEMDYSKANAHILGVLIEKNYTLPFRALDGLVFHFLKVRSQQEEMPVSWHQSLLSFVRLYAKDISSEQRKALVELTKVKSHHQITSEVQRILQNSESRNEESEANVPEYAREEEGEEGMDL